MQSKKIKYLAFRSFTIALFAIPIAILLWLAYRERNLLFGYKWEFRWRFVGLSFVLFTVAFGIAAVVWTDIMRAFGSETTTDEHIRYFSLSQLAKRLPGTVWYFLGREYLYKQQSEMPWLASVASGLELAISTLAGGLLAVSLVPSIPMKSSFLHFSGFLFLILGALLLAHPRVMQWILSRTHIRINNWPRYQQILRWIGAYLLIWILGGVAFWAITSIFVVTEYSSVLSFVGAWSLVGALSILVLILPTNLGFSEIGLSIFLAYFFPLPLAITLAILNRITFMLYDIAIVVAITFGYTALQKLRYQQAPEKQL